MEHEQIYHEIFNNICDGIYFVDNERRITLWNKAAEDITGYKREEIVGKCCHDNLLNHIDKNGRCLCVTGCPLFATTIDGNQRKAEVFLRHKEGHRIPILANIFPIRGEGSNIIGAIEIFTPKSPVVYDDSLIESLSNMAMSDQLTGLANRRKIENYLEYRFNEMKRFHNKFCVTFLDIDNFRDFNNTYGHETGDDVLKSVAKSVMHIIRKSDIFGRWGGEEFIGVFEIKEDYESPLLAEKVRVLVSRTEIPNPQGGEALSVTVSLGVTAAKDNDTIERLVNRADELMYRSKQNGKNRITSDIQA